MVAQAYPATDDWWKKPLLLGVALCATLYLVLHASTDDDPKTLTRRWVGCSDLYGAVAVLCMGARRGNCTGLHTCIVELYGARRLDTACVVALDVEAACVGEAGTAV